MDNAVRHIAGSADDTLRYRFSLDLYRARMDDARSMLLARFIEFWCQKNCIGPWRVMDDGRHVMVWFQTGRDIVLFKMTEEYDFFDTAFSTYEDRDPLSAHFLN